MHQAILWSAEADVLRHHIWNYETEQYHSCQNEDNFSNVSVGISCSLEVSPKGRIRTRQFWRTIPVSPLASVRVSCTNHLIKRFTSYPNFTRQIFMKPVSQITSAHQHFQYKISAPNNSLAWLDLKKKICFFLYFRGNCQTSIARLCFSFFGNILQSSS